MAGDPMTSPTLSGLGQAVAEVCQEREALAVENERLRIRLAAVTDERDAALARAETLVMSRDISEADRVRKRDALIVARGATNLIREAASMALTDIRRGTFYAAKESVDAIHANARSGIDAIDAALNHGKGESNGNG